MNFNQLILDKLSSTFQKNDLHVVEQFEDYVKLQSNNLIVVFSHDKREKSDSVYIGTVEDSLIPLNNFVLSKAFNSGKKIENVTTELFVDNLVLFFENEGEYLIGGNCYAVEAAKNYANEEAKTYTDQLIRRQNLSDADRAWEEGNRAMNFQIVGDKYYNNIRERIRAWIPEFDSVFDEEGEIYPMMGELGTFIVDNFKNDKIRRGTVCFIDEAIEEGGYKTETVIVLEIFQKICEDVNLSLEFVGLFNDKTRLVFNKYLIEYKKSYGND